MSRYLDSSVLVSLLLPHDSDFPACDALLAEGGHWTTAPALNETFATLTGGRLGIRIDAAIAAEMIRESILPCVRELGIRGQCSFSFIFSETNRLKFLEAFS